jgi:hypothetical protein
LNMARSWDRLSSLSVSVRGASDYGVHHHVGRVPASMSRGEFMG